MIYSEQSKKEEKRDDAPVKEGEEKKDDEESSEGEESEEDEEVFETNWDESVEKFDDLGLKEEVLRGIYGHGFEKPSQI